MKPNSFRSLLGALIALSSTFILAPAASADAGTAKLDAARAFRNSLVVNIVQGKETPASILAELKATASPTGIGYQSAAADFAFGAMDVGQRLVAVGKHKEAVVVFKEVEIALALLVSTTPDAQPQGKAQYLQSLALIRGHYLGEFSQAKTDLDKALVLQPSNLTLQALQKQLASEHPELFAPTN